MSERGEAEADMPVLDLQYQVGEAGRCVVEDGAPVLDLAEARGGNVQGVVSQRGNYERGLTGEAEGVSEMWRVRSAFSSEDGQG